MRKIVTVSRSFSQNICHLSDRDDFLHLRSRLSSISSAMTKVVGATYANLHACIPLMREVIQAKCTTRQHRQQEARDKATAEKEERKKVKADFVQKKTIKQSHIPGHAVGGGTRPRHG